MNTTTKTIQQLFDDRSGNPFSILRGYLHANGSIYWDRSAGCYCNEKWVAENDKSTNWLWGLKFGDDVVHTINTHVLLANDEITFPSVI